MGRILVFQTLRPFSLFMDIDFWGLSITGQKACEIPDLDLSPESLLEV